MKNIIILLIAIGASFCLGYFIKDFLAKEPKKTENKKVEEKVEPKVDTAHNNSLGAFSISLSVKNLMASKEFYENLGFSSMGGDTSQQYLIMKNGNALIGIFQGMFEGNILTFNPGWNENAKNYDPFKDVREIQRELKTKKVALQSEADEKTKGPASIMFKDPDGNMVLIDQHR